MTRINVIPPARLTDEHLLAEWRELPRALRLPVDDRPTPPRYVLGAGHMRFFLPRLGWLGRRHAALTAELVARGYNLTPRPPLPTDGGDYTPDDDARAVNLARLADRLRGAKRGQHHYGRAVSAGFYDDQEMR